MRCAASVSVRPTRIEARIIPPPARGCYATICEALEATMQDVRPGSTVAHVDFEAARSTILTKERYMSGVRVLVGTRKGAFVLTSDGKRERGDGGGPYFGGWAIHHLTDAHVDPNIL